jgi:4-amino-4-deoxy-L-arabinose transferase-like glycosyltransferase
MTLDALPAAPAGGSSTADAASLAGRLSISERALGRIALVGVTVLAAVLYLSNLAISGYANSYYSAAALAASQSWGAWFFGSFDAANFITVDKPPLATMLMGLSVRLFGLSSWSILLPQALCGVATVALLFLIVRRGFGVAAASIAAIVCALTPAAVLIFRYNNPDALLTLLLVLSAAAFLRGLENGRLRWAVAAAVLVGLAFNVKYLQAWLVLPAFAVTYVLCAPGSVRRRLAALGAALLAVVAASGWWITIMEFIPVAQRPYVGGTNDNSALDLVLGYDGLGRIFGPGSVVGQPALPPGAGGALSLLPVLPGGVSFGGLPASAGIPFGGPTDLLRLANARFGGGIAWLIPFSLISLAAGLGARWHAPRTDLRRAAYLMWGLWLLVHIAVFSFMSGIIHTYYVVVLAPAIGALVGMGTLDLWALLRRHRLGGVPLAAAVAISAVVAWQLVLRTPEFMPGLATLVLAGGLLAAAAIVLAPLFAAPAVRQRGMQRGLATGGLGLALVVLITGPAAYAQKTVSQAQFGSDPVAGPAAIAPSMGEAGFPVGPNGTAYIGPGAEGADAALVSYLLANRGDQTWIVAVASSQAASSIQLATRAPVLSMGGFAGTDPVPTLEQLQSLAATGQLRYVLLLGNWPDSGNGSQITDWVRSTGTLIQYGGSSGTLFDLSASANS